jgi:hypothetical protein
VSEEAEQCAVIEWSLRYDKLRWLHSSLNGAYLHGTKEQRARQWKKLEKQGAKSGVLDLFLPVVMPPYHGLYIEMKYGKNKLTDKQAEFRDHCESQGYKVVICYTSAEAINAIKNYMRM